MFETATPWLRKKNEFLFDDQSKATPVYLINKLLWFLVVDAKVSYYLPSLKVFFRHSTLSLYYYYY